MKLHLDGIETVRNVPCNTEMNDSLRKIRSVLQRQHGETRIPFPVVFSEALRIAVETLENRGEL